MFRMNLWYVYFVLMILKLKKKLYYYYSHKYMKKKKIIYMYIKICRCLIVTFGAFRDCTNGIRTREKRTLELFRFSCEQYVN